MSRRIVMIVTLVALLAGTAGLWRRGSFAASQEDRIQGNTVVILLQGLSFVPDTVRIPVGTTVLWINESQMIHTTTADGDKPLWDSGNLLPGDLFDFTFKDAGTYPYHCIPHQSLGMVGTIIVTDSGKEPDKEPSRK